MTRPTTPATWDSNGTNTVAVTGSHQTDGWGTDEVPTSAEMNDWQKIVGDWVAYLDSGGRGTTISPAGLTANQDNWAPAGIATAGHVRVTITTIARNITGIAAGQTDGRRITLSAVDGNVWTLKNEDLGSTDINRFAGPNGADVLVNHPGYCVTLLYDGTLQRWLIESKNF